MLKRFRVSLPILLLILAVSAAAEPPAPGGAPILGFSAASAAEQHSLEARFDSYLSPAAELRDWLKRLSARPHHVGSPYGKENAEFMAGLFRSWGFQTEIEQFKVLFPTPKTRVLEMVAPTRFTASLSEPPLKED